MKRQISILACLLMLVAIVFAVASCSKPKELHVHDYEGVVTKEATCTEKGEITYTCTCGNAYTDEVSAKGHNEAVLPAVAPTCTTEGKEQGYGCLDCGFATVPQATIAALGHELGAPATCTTAQTCAREGCDVVFVEALGHDAPEATCTEASVCEVCKVELAPANGHKPSEATCTEPSVCTVCNVEQAPALGHTLAKGMECFSFWCDRCGMEWVEATKEHEYFYDCDQFCMNCYEPTRMDAQHSMKFIDAKAPTCTELGNIEYWTCELCNGCWDNHQAMGMPLNHMVVKVPMVDHEYRYACDAHCMNCGNLTNEEAAHTISHVDAVAPTCTENGNIEYWTCTDCGACWDNENMTGAPLNRMMVIVGALGHTYTNACDGWCAVCYEFTNPDAAHKLSYVPAVAPTCTVNGNIEHWACEYCGGCWDNSKAMYAPLNQRMVIAPATGHKYAVECDPVCLVCQEIDPEIGHDIQHVAAKAATCTAAGNIEYWYCTYCELCWTDEALTANTAMDNTVIPAKGHNGYDYDRKCDVCNLYVLPEEGVAFKLYLVQGSVSGKPTLYFNGAYEKTYYFGTTKNCYASPDIFIEEATDGFYMYFMSNTTKNYISVQANGSKNNPTMGSTKGLFTFDEKTGAFITKTKNGTLYLGTYGTYTTISASYTSYITGNSAANVDKTQFILRPEILVPHACEMSEATCSKAPTCSICGKVEGDALPHTPGAEATCTAAQTCTVCNKVLVAKLAHTGGTATCTAKANCEVCGTAYGNLAAHTGGTATCTTQAKCEVCDTAYGSLANHTGGTATCTAKANCEVCGTAYGNLAAHNLVDNACTNCDYVKPATVTVKTTISTYADANGWSNGTKYTSVKMDENIKVTCSGTDDNTGKYYTSGENWRMYQTGSAKVTITASNGKTIKSVKVSYAIEKGGVLKNGSTTVSSGTVVTVNATSITLTVGNSGSATNGQARITAIEVIYE